MRRSPLSTLAALALAVVPLLGGAAAVATTTSAPHSRPAATVALAPQADDGGAAGTTATRPASGRSALRGSAASYAFLHVDAGQPVRWNPCAPVPWTFNPQGAPAGGLTAVQAALRELSARTGLTFAYQGTSNEVPSVAYLGQRWQHFKPLLVGWSTSGASDLLAGRGTTTVGVARVLWTGSYDATGANHTQIASGAVAFNRAVRAPASGGGSWTTYAMHELGHAVGLAHVDDGSQVMNPVIGDGVTGYGAGDLAGLRRVGSAGGCLPSIR